MSDRQGGGLPDQGGNSDFFFLLRGRGESTDPHVDGFLDGVSLLEIQKVLQDGNFFRVLQLGRKGEQVGCLGEIGVDGFLRRQDGCFIGP